MIETEKTAFKSNLLEDNSHEVSNGFVNKGRNLLQFGSKSCLPLLTSHLLTTTKYYSKAIVLAADLSLESHLKTSVTALILRGARQQPISTKKFKEDKFRCGLLLLQYFFLNV